jgi:hypothetical protein
MYHKNPIYGEKKINYNSIFNKRSNSEQHDFLKTTKLLVDQPKCNFSNKKIVEYYENYGINYEENMRFNNQNEKN